MNAMCYMRYCYTLVGCDDLLVNIDVQIVVN